MGKADIYESDYLEDAEIFADLINGALYEGEQIVKPEELQEQDGELRSVIMGRIKKTIRDKVRIWKGKVFVILAVENQTEVDYHMVIRNLLLEGMAYDRQWKELRAAHEKKEDLKSSAELLSGMKKGEKFLPVITIVVYFGRKGAWDGARTLYELLDVGEDAEKVLPYISNYKLNLFDYHDYESFEQFHTELQSVFEFLRYAEDKEKLREKLEKNKERYGKLSTAAKALLVQLANIREIPGVSEGKVKKGEFEMCKAFEDMKMEGRIEGKTEGIEIGRREGQMRIAEALVKSVESAMKNFHIDLSQACEGWGSNIKEYEAAKKMLGKA